MSCPHRFPGQPAQIQHAVVGGASASARGVQCRSPQHPKGDEEHPPLVPCEVLVLCDSKRSKSFAKRLRKRWQRLALSKRIKQEIGANTWSQKARLCDIRSALSQKLGVSLESGRARSFFDRQLQRIVLQPRSRGRQKPRKAKRKAKTTHHLLTDSWLGGEHTAHREHARMRCEDFLSRRLREKA